MLEVVRRHPLLELVAQNTVLGRVLRYAVRYSGHAGIWHLALISKKALVKALCEEIDPG